MVRTGTTGTGFAKFGFWLAGYYDDFQGSRCIADDTNTPSADNAYDANATHHGNVMNGEATLNPRYRWSVRDRANNSEFSSSSNYLLLNDGIARWATTDTNRLSKGLLCIVWSQTTLHLPRTKLGGYDQSRLSFYGYCARLHADGSSNWCLDGRKNTDRSISIGKCVGICRQSRTYLSTNQE